MTFPLPVVISDNAITSASIVGHTIANESTSLTLPTGLKAGDLLVTTRSCNNASPTAVPSGWTLAHSYGNANGIFSDNGAQIAYRIVQSSSESGTTVSGFAGGSGLSGTVCFHIRGNTVIRSVTVQDTYGSASSGGTGNPTSNASDSSLCTVSVASMGILGQISSASSLIGTSTNFGTFRNAAGGTDPISGSQNYLAGDYDAGDDDHSGNVGYAFCQSPATAVDIYVDNTAGNVSSLVTCYLELRN
jgi:hypothetical protein